MQVGACDGNVTETLKDFILGGVAHAVLVEPNPAAFAGLKKSYEGALNVTLVHAAIGDKEGEAYLYRVKDGALRNTDHFPILGYSSFDLSHLTRNGIKPSEIERITVPTRTLASVVAETGLAKIDLLQIDVEGYDAEVVRMALELPNPPSIIECEHCHLTVATRAELFSRLEKADYLFTSDSGNVLALKKEVLDEWTATGISSTAQA
jgi:FkbM family methyltransferase